MVIVRLLMPIDLREFAEAARAGKQSAGLVILGLSVLLSSVFLGLVLWAQP